MFRFRCAAVDSLPGARSIKKMKEITRTVARVRNFVQDLPSTTTQVCWVWVHFDMRAMPSHSLQFDGGVSVTVETLDTRPPAAVAAAAAAAAKGSTILAASDSDEETPIKVAPPPLRPSGQNGHKKRLLGLLRARMR
jgi:hypothetical protein